MSVEDWAPEEAEAELEFDSDLPEVLAGLATEGESYPTGFPFFDRNTRKGGIPRGRVIAVGGAPGSGKTTLACWIINRMSPRMPTIGLFADEGREAAGEKLALQLGYPRAEIDNPSPTFYARMRTRLEDLFRLVNPQHPKATAEDVFNRLMELPANAAMKNGPRLAVWDSAQRIRSLIGQKDDTDTREAISILMWGIRKRTLRDGLISVVTSQSPRDFYKSKKEADRINPLAAFAGSRAIEYAADACIVLGMPDANGVRRVDLCKNRLGPDAVGYVKLDKERMMLVEVDATERVLEGVRSKQNNRQVTLDALKPEIHKAIAKHGELSGRQVRELVPGGTDNIRVALGQMVEKGELAPRKVGATKMLYALPDAPGD